MNINGSNRQDIVGGLLLIAIGLFAAIYAYSSYRLGTVARMGPGMVPVILGALLVFLGGLLLVPALIRGIPTTISVEWRPLIAIGLSVFLFGVTVDRFGMIPAVVLIAVMCSFADNKLRPLQVAALALVMCIVAVGIFNVGLGMPIRIFRWPL